MDLLSNFNEFLVIACDEHFSHIAGNAEAKRFYHGRAIKSTEKVIDYASVLSRYNFPYDRNLAGIASNGHLWLIHLQKRT